MPTTAANWPAHPAAGQSGGRAAQEIAAPDVASQLDFPRAITSATQSEGLVHANLR
jgi:hypothetical protein